MLSSSLWSSHEMVRPLFVLGISRRLRFGLFGVVLVLDFIGGADYHVGL